MIQELEEDLLTHCCRVAWPWWVLRARFSPAANPRDFNLVFSLFPLWARPLGLKAGTPTCAGAKPTAGAPVPCTWQDRASWGAEMGIRRRWPGRDGVEL